jgi:hypothetical protein
MDERFNKKDEERDLKFEKNLRAQKFYLGIVVILFLGVYLKLFFG